MEEAGRGHLASAMKLEDQEAWQGAQDLELKGLGATSSQLSAWAE